MLVPKSLTDASSTEIVLNGQIESISIQEKGEQSIIEQSVEVKAQRVTVCNRPQSEVKT